MKRIRLVEAAPKYIAMKDGRRFPVSVEYNEVPDDWQGGVHPDTYTIGVNGQSIEVDATETERQCVAKGLSSLGYQLAESLRRVRHEAFSPDTVAIGNQIWMAENLDVDDGGEGIYFNAENGEHYYSWHAAMRIAKSIPGWHLPAAGEWDAAAETCGALKAPGGYNVYAHVESLQAKLNIELAGRSDFRRDGERAIYYENVYANFWTSTEETSSVAYSRDFSGDGDMYRNTFSKHRVACSVRLVKD